MKGVLYWPAERVDLLGAMRVGAELAKVDTVVESFDELDLADADYFVVSDGHIDQAMLDLIRAAPRLKFIQLTSSGAESARSAGLVADYQVSHAPMLWAPSVADHGVALAFALLRQVPLLRRLQAERSWDSALVRSRLRGIGGMTAAILGCGTIGRLIGEKLAPFEVTRIGVNRDGSTSAGESFSEYQPISALPDVLRRSDLVFLCLPMNDATHHLIGAEELRLLGPDSYLINIARGPIVDFAALDDALKTGTIAGAALDVTDPEPLPPDSPIWGYDNVLISPHVGSHPADAARIGARLGELLSTNVRRLADGLEPQCLVPPVRG